MIDEKAAKAYVMANYPNDPLLRHIAVNLLDTLPKVDAIPVDDIAKWLYQIAMNNVGDPSMLSASCLEIIKRLNGLVVFSKERGGNGGN